MITLDTIDSAFHSVQIKDADGDVLAIDAAGKIGAIVEATDLDIRNLAFATDKVDASGSVVALDAPTLAALESITVQNGAGAAAVNIQDGGNSITVDGTVELGATTLAALENITVAQGTSPWVVGDGGGSLTVDGTVELGATTLAALESITVQNAGGGAAVNIQDGGNSITVDAADLDIRDLSHSQDSVKIGDGTDFLAVNADGSINVQTVEAGYSSWSVIAASVDSTAGGTQLAVAPLSGRLRVEIQNLGDKDIYVRQSTGVTTANGLKIPKGTSYEQALDAGAAIWAITPSGTADIRIAQYAA